MEVYNPCGISRLSATTPVPSQAQRKEHRVLLIHNQRPSAHPVMPGLFQRLQVRLDEVETIEVQSGHDVVQIQRESSGFDAVVIGVGD